MRLTKNPAVETFPVDDIPLNIYCVEEDLIGYKLYVRVYNAYPNADKINLIRLLDAGDNILSSTTDEMWFSGGYANPALYDDLAISWILPGVGFRLSQSFHPSSGFTGDREITYTISNNQLSEKGYDGGIHCWIKLDTHTEDNPFYSKLIPNNIIQNRNCLLVFNSACSWHGWTIAGNVAFTLKLLGSVDGTNFETVATILDDINIADQTAHGYTFQIPHVLSGLNYSKYNYFKFSFGPESGAGATRAFLKQSFARLSLYPL